MDLKPENQETLIAAFKISMRHPLTLSVAVFFFLFYAVFEIPGDKLEIWLPETFLLLCIWAVCWISFYYWSIYLAGPKLIKLSLKYRISFPWSFSIFVSLLEVVEAIVTTVFFDPSASLSKVLSFWFYNTILLTFFVSLLCYFFKERFIEILGINVMTFTPFFPMPKVINKLQDMLPKDIQGVVEEIETQNQSVMVRTENGSSFIPMRMKEAVQYVPDDAGWIVHRSRWIKKTQVKGLTYISGNPFIIDKDGKQFPISRTKRDIIRDYLEEG